MGYEAIAMTHHNHNRGTGKRISFAVALLACSAAACGAPAVRSGVGVGAVGQGLALHADSTPQGAQVCLWQDSLGPQPVGTEKSMGDTCIKALKTDSMWRRALLVLSLYGERVEAVAGGADADTSGKLEAARSGVTSVDWSDADDQPARDAVTSLVMQLSATSDTKVDLSKIVQDAAPFVKTLCDGLGNYLDVQSQNLSVIQKDIDKKRISHTARRCGMLEKQTICVGDSVVDRMVYADVFGHVVSLENSTLETRDSLTRFCVAHEKLAAAAANGQLTKKQTYFDVVEAVKAVPRAQPQWNTPEAAPAKPAEPAKK